ncbi:2,3-diaminopropionate biosynthesis protein SbnA [Streptomyces huiliensis]|uniref:2,3-diaminopropionate biosynthesis protein SbnA n=1 Tax=Streptomyces huiliensis TaxID=2876027 RepID=UPI001CC0591B|nr:2,3-diaminopropionate biosynthesis protein SbnA [Streptomyces huiliensis]MBZ4319772.1 2,3-diaminopropionate biosynthesis protein SbnA [Streptomyces huiliensis]
MLTQAMPSRGIGGVLDTIGGTPLIELDRIFPDLPFRLFAKLEKFNPGGSVKDRVALNMLLEKVSSGELVPGRSAVVESSSGNLAIGLAQVCRYFGLRFICVVDAKTTEQNIAIIRSYGAEVEVITEPDPETGEFLPSRIRRVRELVRSVPDAYWPNQYGNPLNAAAHELTMREIVEGLNGRLDYLFCATSSCGTLRGCADYVRKSGLSTEIVAVDALGSAIFGGQSPTTRLLPGHGAALRPALFDPRAADHVVHVSDLECVRMCRRLVDREAILAGGSSGAVIAAVERMRDAIPDGSRVAVVFPDSGERYLETIYSDSWVARKFGDVSHLWQENPGPVPETVGAIPC